MNKLYRTKIWLIPSLASLLLEGLSGKVLGYYTTLAGRIGIGFDSSGAAVLRIRFKNTAPGPDGIPARVMARAFCNMSDHLREVLDASLASERFPEYWKSGKLVLLMKPKSSTQSVFFK